MSFTVQDFLMENACENLEGPRVPGNLPMDGSGIGAGGDRDWRLGAGQWVHMPTDLGRDSFEPQIRVVDPGGEKLNQKTEDQRSRFEVRVSRGRRIYALCVAQQVTYKTEALEIHALLHQRQREKRTWERWQICPVFLNPWIRIM